MTIQPPERRRTSVSRDPNHPAPRQPNERDESADRQGGPPRGVMRQAASDLEQGLVDTDRRGTPGIEQAVIPTGDGQARPLPDRDESMRDRPPRRGGA